MRTTWIIRIAAGVALAFSGCSNDDSKTTAFGETVTGEATYYGADGSGACMFDAAPSDIHVAALNRVQWDDAKWCGACADVTGPNGTTRIRIVDQCPECRFGDLDFHPVAFDEIAERQLGRVDISWQLVACDVSGNVSYKYKDGANEWWTAVQVRNHRLPIESMAYTIDGSTWQPMVREPYNYFLAENGFGKGSVKVRITAVDGQTLEDELPPVQAELEVRGTGQFRSVMH